MGRGLNEAEHAALAQIAGANAADENGEHGWAYPEDQTDLALASALLAEGYIEAAVAPGSANPVYPMLDLQHGLKVTPAGLEVLTHPFIVGRIWAEARPVDGYTSGHLVGLSDTLYCWSDGVVTWTMERTFA